MKARFYKIVVHESWLRLMPDLIPLRVLPSGYFSFKWNKQNKTKHLLPWDKRINIFLHKPHFSFFYRIRFLSVLHNSVSKWKLRINQPYKTGGGCCVFVARDRANKHLRTVRTSIKQASIKLISSFKWDKWLKTLTIIDGHGMNWYKPGLAVALK